MQLGHELAIARPPTEVFDVLADPNNLPLWQHSVERVTAPGEITLGSRFIEERSRVGRTFRSTLEVVEFERDRLLTIRVVDGPVPATIRHELVPGAEGTILRIRADGDFDRLPRPLRALVVRTIKSDLVRDFATLKAMLERTPRHASQS